MPDALESALRQSPLTQAQRADLWDAYQGAGNEDDLATKLQGFKVPKEVKAKLWDLKAGEAKPELGIDPPTANPDKSPIEVGDPRFEAAKAKGEMEGGAASAGPVLGILGGGLAGGGAPTVVPMALHALENPVIGGALGAAEGYQSGGVKGALIHGAIGALGGPLLGRLAPLQRAAKAVKVAEAVAPAAKAAGIAAEAAPVVEAAAKAIPATIAGEKILLVVDAAGKPLQTFTNAAEAVNFAHKVKQATKAATTVVETAPMVAKAATTTAKAAPVATDRGAALVQFVKDVAARNPKLGEKIWVALDNAGNPVRILTPDQAGAAKRAGQATTWVRNLWK